MPDCSNPETAKTNKRCGIGGHHGGGFGGNNGGGYGGGYGGGHGGGHGDGYHFVDHGHHGHGHQDHDYHLRGMRLSLCFPKHFTFIVSSHSVFDMINAVYHDNL